MIVIEEYNENGRDYVVFEAVNPDKFDPFPFIDSPGLYAEYILLVSFYFLSIQDTSKY